MAKYGPPPSRQDTPAPTGFSFGGARPPSEKGDELAAKREKLAAQRAAQKPSGVVKPVIFSEILRRNSGVILAVTAAAAATAAYVYNSRRKP